MVHSCISFKMVSFPNYLILGEAAGRGSRLAIYIQPLGRNNGYDDTLKNYWRFKDRMRGNVFSCNMLMTLLFLWMEQRKVLKAHLTFFPIFKIFWTKTYLSNEGIWIGFRINSVETMCNGSGTCIQQWTNAPFNVLHIVSYGRPRLIRSIWRASKFSVFKIDWNCNFVGLSHHPFWLQLVLAPFGHYFSYLLITLSG